MKILALLSTEVCGRNSLVIQNANRLQQTKKVNTTTWIFSAVISFTGRLQCMSYTLVPVENCTYFIAVMYIAMYAWSLWILISLIAIKGVKGYDRCLDAWLVHDLTCPRTVAVTKIIIGPHWQLSGLLEGHSRMCYYLTNGNVTGKPKNKKQYLAQEDLEVSSSSFTGCLWAT